jgi:hypothetical protein
MTEHPILSSQRGRVSEVTQNVKAQRNEQPLILGELCNVEAESYEAARCCRIYSSKVGNRSCRERTAVTVETKSLQASSSCKCSNDCATQVYPYDCELDIGIWRVWLSVCLYGKVFQKVKLFF